MSKRHDVASLNDRLAALDAEHRLNLVLEELDGPYALSSSFGIQAAVMLHLVTRRQPGIPVIFIDTGYLFPETYRFVDELTERLNLNLQVYRAAISPAWQEARHGRRWEQGAKGIRAYNRAVKVEPMQRALRGLNARIWFSGLRRVQSRSRATTPFVQSVGGRWKVQPVADWTDYDVHAYLTKHNLPYHPLRERGYISVGDVHTTRALHEVDSPDDTRFFGLMRECGIHEPDVPQLPRRAAGC